MAAVGRSLAGRLALVTGKVKLAGASNVSQKDLEWMI